MTANTPATSDTTRTAAPEQPAAPVVAPAPIDTDSVKTIDLDYPLQRASGEITRLTIRKPNAGALRGTTLLAIVQIDVQALRTVLPRVCDPILTPAEILNMDPADLMAAGATLSSFFMSRAERAAIQMS